MFHVGQKVICINDEKYAFTTEGNGNLHGLKKGSVYTIREFLNDPRWHTTGVRLVEIIRPICSVDHYETPYWSGRFRPIVERKTDISIFTKILNSKQHDLCGNE